jgi:hypothetical protein
MRGLPSSIFFQRTNLIGTSPQKKTKLLRYRKIAGSILKYRVSSLWPTYIGERRTTFAKAYGIKVRHYGEHVGEHIGNLGTYRGSDENLKGT